MSEGSSSTADGDPPVIKFTASSDSLRSNEHGEKHSKNFLDLPRRFGPPKIPLASEHEHGHAPSFHGQIENNQSDNLTKRKLLRRLDVPLLPHPGEETISRRRSSPYLSSSTLLPVQPSSYSQVYDILDSEPGLTRESSLNLGLLKEIHERPSRTRSETETQRNPFPLAEDSAHPGSPDIPTSRLPEQERYLKRFPLNSSQKRLKKVLLLPRFEILINFLVFLDWLILASVAFEVHNENVLPTFFGAKVSWPYYLRYLLNGIFLVEILLKLYAYGLLVSPHPSTPEVCPKTRAGPGYISNQALPLAGTVSDLPDLFFNVVGSIDLISVSAFWINAILCLPGLDQNGWGNWSLVVALSALRPLRLLTIIPQFSSIIKLISKFLPLLSNLAFFLAYFSMLFATLGLILFKGHGRSQCHFNNNILWTKRYCGGHYTNSEPPRIEYLSLEGDGYAEPLFPGYICPYPYKCEMTETKLTAYTNFDTFFHSILSVYVVSSVESWTVIMHRMMATFSPLAAIFFICCVMVLNYCLVTLFVAVIARIFEKIREEKDAALRQESKAYAPAPVVENSFAFGLVQPPPKADAPDGSYSDGRFRWSDRVGEVEAAIIKALPLLNLAALILIGADLLTRSNYVGLFSLYPQIYLPINSLLFAESIFQLLRLRHSRLLRVANPNVPHDIGVWWMRIGICLQFVLCLVCVVVSICIFKGMILPKERALLSILAILRFYRLAVSVPRIQSLLCVLAARFSGMASLMGFILASIFLLAPLYIHLVCLSLDDAQHAGTVFAYFGSLRYAMLALFQIFSGEDWPEVMIENTFVLSSSSRVVIILSFVAWSAFSNLVLLNLFIAQTMECFELPESQKRRSQIKVYVDSATKASAYKQKNPIGVLNPYRYLEPAPLFIKPLGFPRALLLRIPRYLANSFLGHKDAHSATHSMTERSYLRARFEHSYPMYDTSWFLFRPEHPLRRLCRQLVEPNYRGHSLVFNTIVLIAVAVAVGMALINTPQYRRETVLRSQEHYFIAIDLALAAFFLFEFVVRTIAHGFLLTPNAYLKHPWYVVEFVVLVVFLVDVGVLPLPVSHFNQIVRGLKAFRALRLMSLVPKVKDTLYGVFIIGFSRILDVSLLLLSLIVPFAFYGHLLFSAQGFSCSDPSVPVSSACRGEFINRDSLVYMPRIWANYNTFSFETIGGSMLVLVEILSGEKWIRVLESAMRFSGEAFTGVTPENWWYCLYFVLYYIVGSIIVMSMFVAVIIENYRRYTGAARLTSNQRHWIDLRKQLLQTMPSLRPIQGMSPLRQLCRRCTTEKNGMWPNAVSFAHLLLLLCLATEFHGQGRSLSHTKSVVRGVLLTISLVDHAIRMLGLGWITLLRSPWNSAHAVTSGMAWAVTFVSIFCEAEPFLDDMSNILCLGVTLKLMFRSNRLTKLAKMASASLPNILMTLYAWLVLFITYSILFIQIFGLTRYGEQGSDVANFRSFGITMLMLFRMTTGEGWNDIMHDYAVQQPFCVYSADYLASDCGNPALAYILFLSFNVLSMFIFANLFVVIVIDNFNYCHDVTSSFTLLTRADIRQFKHTWSLFDHQARGYIPRESLIPFLMSLKSPFNVNYVETRFGIKALKKSYAALGPADPTDYQSYLQWLVEKLAQMPRHRLARRRRRFNIIHLHAMSLEEPGKGISFTNVLLLLSQYKLIDPEQCLSIQDLLQFKKAQKSICDTYHREKALGLCRTWILRRNFLKNLESRQTFPTPAPPMIFLSESVDFESPTPYSSRDPHNNRSERSSCSHLMPPHSPATSSSASSWFMPLNPAIVTSSPCSESSDAEETDPQEVLKSLAQNPWAVCLGQAVQLHKDDSF